MTVNGTMKMMKKMNKVLLVFSILIFVVGLTVTAVEANQHEGEPKEVAQAASDGMSRGLGFIAIALATGFSTIGAGMAVSNVGAAAIGSITEKPELFGRSLIFVGLAEGIAIYGLIISILLITKI